IPPGKIKRVLVRIISLNARRSAFCIQRQSKWIAFGVGKVHPVGTMTFEYDVVIIGGAFSGAATALMLKRKRPQARVLIIEKSAEFDRKVGQSSTEVSNFYITPTFGLTPYLAHHPL